MDRERGQGLGKPRLIDFLTLDKGGRLNLRRTEMRDPGKKPSRAVIIEKFIPDASSEQFIGSMVVTMDEAQEAKLWTLNQPENPTGVELEKLLSINLNLIKILNTFES